jgi:hypothetical protein
VLAGKTRATAIAFCILCGGTSAQQQPRACTYIWQEPPPGGLSGQQTDVLSREVTFLQNEFRVRTFSDTAPSGAFSEQCYRYEVENTGAKEIAVFGWPLGEILVNPFKPGRPRQSSIKRRPAAPVNIESTVFAFENEPAQTRAYAEQRTGSLPPTPQGMSRITMVRPESVVSGVDKFLSEQKLPSREYMAFYLDEPKVYTPTLEDHYSAPGVNIDVFSRAERTEKEIRIVTVVEAKNNEELFFSLPGLHAWEKFRGPLSDLGQYSAFVSAFNSARDNPEKNKGQWVFEWTLPPEASAVYRMDHPILIFGKDRRDCVMVASYVPSPIGFSLDNCRVKR